MKVLLVLKLVLAAYLSMLPVNAALLDHTDENMEKEMDIIVDMWGENVVSEDAKESPIVWENPEEYKVWAEKSEKWQEIFAESQEYPELMLEDLKRNPEILEFVYGYPNASKEVLGGLTEAEKEEVCPLFMQWDSRWGYVEYGNYNIGISGCGPTCLSMVLYSFTRDEALTPDHLAKMAMERGYYVSGSGTAWSFMTDVAKEYGVAVSQEAALNEEKMIETLKKDGLIICSMRPGDFTATGHFIVICGYDGEKFTVNDPFSYSNSYKKWDYETLVAQAKQVWYYN